MKVFAIIVFLAAVAGAVVYVLMKKGVIKDEDGNNIPDSVDEKVAKGKAIISEVKEKVEEVLEEVQDVPAKLNRKKPGRSRKPAAKKIVHSTPVEPVKEQPVKTQKDLAIEKYKKAQK